MQAYLFLLGLALLCFTGVAFLTNWRQDPPPAKRLHLALLRYWLYYGGLEWNLQYLWGMPVLVSYRCCNILPQIHWLQDKFILWSFWRSEVKNKSKGAKIKMSTWLVSSGGSWGEPHLPLLEIADLPGFWLHHFNLYFCGRIPFSFTTDKSCSASHL